MPRRAQVPSAARPPAGLGLRAPSAAKARSAPAQCSTRLRVRRWQCPCARPDDSPARSSSAFPSVPRISPPSATGRHPRSQSQSVSAASSSGASGRTVRTGRLIRAADVIAAPRLLQIAGAQDPDESLLVENEEVVGSGAMRDLLGVLDRVVGRDRRDGAVHDLGYERHGLPHWSGIQFNVTARVRGRQARHSRAGEMHGSSTTESRARRHPHSRPLQERVGVAPPLGEDCAR